jgi:hypothetical protein
MLSWLSRAVVGLVVAVDIGELDLASSDGNPRGVPK